VQVCLRCRREVEGEWEVDCLSVSDVGDVAVERDREGMEGRRRRRRGRG
jgi:hypothetical protein